MEINLDKDPVISATEVKDFVFCPVSFLLKRAGIKLENYEPETAEEKETVERQLELTSAGRIFHEEIVKKIEEIFKKEKSAKESSNIGILILIIAIIFTILSLVIK